MASPRRTAFLLAPKTSDGRIARYSREKSDVLSLKPPFFAHCHFLPAFHVFSPFEFEKMSTIHFVVLLSNLNNSKLTFMSFISQF